MVLTATFLSCLFHQNLAGGGGGRESYKCIHTDFWLILHSNTTYSITGKKRLSAKEKNLLLQNLGISQPLGKLISILFLFVGSGSRVGFLLCQSRESCSLISAMALLSICSGKAAKWAGISVGGGRNHLLLWPVLPICPASKSTLLIMGQCERRHLLLTVRTFWFYSTWKLMDWELVRIACQYCRKTMVDSRLQVFGVIVMRCSWCGTCAVVESGPMSYFLHLFICCY